MSKNTKAKKPDNAKGGKSEIVNAVMRMRKGGASIKDIAKKLHIGDRRVSKIIKGEKPAADKHNACRNKVCKHCSAHGDIDLGVMLSELSRTMIATLLKMWVDMPNWEIAKKLGVSLEYVDAIFGRDA